VGQDPYCYPGSSVLRNRLDLLDEDRLHQAERELSEIAVGNLPLFPHPTTSNACNISTAPVQRHLRLGRRVAQREYPEGRYPVLHPERIPPEAAKIIRQMEEANWFVGTSQAELVSKIAEAYGDLNVIHPFREGNGRAQRILFEQIIVNAGFSVNWWLVKHAAWIPANIDAVA
jgi:cell filamentation protein